MYVDISFQENEDLLYGLIEGEIDTYTASFLKDEFERLSIKENSTIELDLSKVTFMDSTGLGVIIAFYKKVLKENANLKLVNLSNRLTRLFEITGLSELMDIETDKKVEPANECI